MKQGEVIEIKTDNEIFKGVFIKQEEGFIIIKLDSGYNIGISERNIKDKKVLEKIRSEDENKKKSSKATKNNSKLPKITLLHTGGTIASKVDYATGAVVAKFEPEELEELFPEIKDIANLDSKLISNIMSENMRFSHINLIAKAIEEEIKKGSNGIIITHGTDTLHYTSAALSFMLENLSIPVVVVGSQRSSDRPSSDSAINLINAATFISNSKSGGVFTCMHENNSDNICLIIEGVNSRKMHSSRRDAFRPINKGLIATVSYEDKKIKWVNHPKKSDGDFKVNLLKEDLKIGLLKSHPNMQPEEIKIYNNFDGLIIEGTGLGHIGINPDNISKDNQKIGEILSIISENLPVVMTTQTIYGRVNMNVYSVGRELLEKGMIGNYCDMTPETAYMKLAYLLSNCKDKKEIKKLFETNLRGEISERSEMGGYFLN